MRILQLTDDLPPAVLGGSGRIAWETSLGLSRLGHEVHILTAGASGSFPDTKDGIRIHTIPVIPRRWAHYRSVFSVRREREVMEVIENIQPDLIHAHGLAWQLGYRWIKPATEHGIPVIYTAHGVMTVAYGKVLDGVPHEISQDLRRMRWEYNPFRNVLIRKALNHCKKIICVSDALKNFLAETGLRNLTTIRNGIDLNFWKEQVSREDARKQLDIPKAKTVFLFAGRIGHDKGSTALDSALPENALLIVAGDTRAGAFGRIKNRVLCYENQSAEQMRLLYAACDVAVVPSIYLDPFPTVCLEAMACSRPVIATCFGGSKEAVLDSITGWIVDPNNQIQLREKLQWCIDHREECEVVGKNARKHMEESFSIERYLQKVMKIYESSRSYIPT